MPKGADLRAHRLESRARPRGRERDEARLLVSSPTGDTHAGFRDLPNLLVPGDLLVVNESATVPASLAATSRLGPCLLNLSTHYGCGVWLAEPRWSTAQPGPLPLSTRHTAPRRLAITGNKKAGFRRLFGLRAGWPQAAAVFIALMRALRRLLWREALFLPIRPRLL